ncbi:MAG TPA: M56 family metallopeptidase [Blastocatellia bacterium]|nr:M56 family metallopeptidase [Blastocatellia bacterium]
MSSMIENLDTLARLLLEALLNTLWQGMLIAVLVWLLLRLANRLSATTRHAVWLVTLLTIGALPLLAVVATRSDPATTARQEAPKTAAQSATPAPANNQQGRPKDEEADMLSRLSWDSAIARRNAPANRAPNQASSQEKIRRDIEPPPQIQEQNVVAAPVSSKVGKVGKVGQVGKVESRNLWGRAKSMLANAFSGQAPLALVGLWLALGALMSWRVARSYRAVFRLRGRLEPAPSEHNGHVERLASLFGIKRPAPVFTSAEVVMPMTIGSLKPVIILPADLADELSQPEFESVVAHELAHIKRWDYLTNMLQRVVQSYLFFHPAVWFICKQLTIERELACDDWAVKTCEPRRYASCLTKLVEALNESKPHRLQRVAATGIGGIVFGKHVISRRVEMILNRDRNATTAVSKPAMLYAIGLVVMFVAVCSLISPVIAVPLGQKAAKQARKENKAAAPAKSQEFPPLPPAPSIPALPPDAADLIEPANIADIPDVPDIPEAPEAPEAPIPDSGSPAGPAKLQGGPIGGVPGGVVGGIPGGVAVQPALPGQGERKAIIAPGGPESPAPAVVWAELGQDNKRGEPAIPEAELISLLVDIVKRDADPNVRNEALQGLYRIRTDAGINALIQLYDGASDVKVKGDIIRYLLRREGGSNKVDNGKAIAKLTSIAKSEQSEELRNKAISYLGNVKGDEGANILIQIYDSLQDQKMKQYVIRSLASNGSRKAVDKLVNIAKNDSDPVVRQYAIRSIYNVDNRRYLELDRKRIGMIDEFSTPRPFILKDNREPLVVFDVKNWEEWQKDWLKNWEEQQEKIRESIEKMRLDGKVQKVDEIMNNLRIEMPKIEIRMKNLKDKIKPGDVFDHGSAVDNQLHSQIANVEMQLSTLLANYSNTEMKTAQMRILRDALEKQLHNARSLRIATTRPVLIRRAAPSPEPGMAPTIKKRAAATSSSF